MKHRGVKFVGTEGQTDVKSEIVFKISEDTKINPECLTFKPFCLKKLGRRYIFQDTDSFCNLGYPTFFTYVRNK